jgi:hypothetical protein
LVELLFGRSSAVPGRRSWWCIAPVVAPLVGACDGWLEFSDAFTGSLRAGMFAAGPGESGRAVSPGVAAAPELGAWVGLLEFVCAYAVSVLAATSAAANVNFLEII